MTFQVKSMGMADSSSEFTWSHIDTNISSIAHPYCEEMLIREGRPAGVAAVNQKSLEPPPTVPTAKRRWEHNCAADSHCGFMFGGP